MSNIKDGEIIPKYTIIIFSFEMIVKYLNAKFGIR